MKTTKGLVIAALVLGASAPAHAEDRGFYLGILGGVNLADEGEFETAQGATDFEDNRDAGWALGGNLGYDWGHIRTEIEFLHRQNKIDFYEFEADGGLSAAVGSSGAFSGFEDAGGGSMRTNGMMFNALYDMQFGDSGWEPYVGIGAGFIRAKYIDYRADSGGRFLDAAKTTAAGQVMGGFRRMITDSIEASASYRYLISGDTDITLANGGVAEPRYRAHAVLLGLTWRFGQTQQVERQERPSPPPPPPAPEPQPEPEPAAEPAPEPAPQPAPAPEPEPAVIPGPFLVFFDWDRADIRPDARRVIEEAAAAYREYGVVRVSLVGHTDLSGPEWYNDRLSIRRGNAVRDVFIALGVDPSDIVVEGRGESNPLVPTEDGVREPQNRRVEIDLIGPDAVE